MLADRRRAERTGAHRGRLSSGENRCRGDGNAKPLGHELKGGRKLRHREADPHRETRGDHGVVEDTTRGRLHRHRDERFTGEVGERHRLAAEQPVTGREDDAESVCAEGFDRQRTLGVARVTEPKNRGAGADLL